MNYNDCRLPVSQCNTACTNFDDGEWVYKPILTHAQAVTKCNAEKSEREERAKMYEYEQKQGEGLLPG